MSQVLSRAEASKSSVRGMPGSNHDSHVARDVKQSGR